MSSPNLRNDTRAAFTNDDLLMAVLLGGLGGYRAMSLLLTRPAFDSSDKLDASHPLVTLALGAISLGRTLERWVEEAAAADCVKPAEPRAESGTSLREFLR